MWQKYIKMSLAVGAVAGPLLALAQSSPERFDFQYDSRASVMANNRVLANPWAGGLNSSQFAQTRLNDDTRPDLVVFDRTSFRVTTFLATDGGWQHAPEYERTFPPLRDWLALVDYDGDGLTDLFTPTALGLGVFRHTRVNGQPVWKVAVNPLFTEGLSGRLPLFVSAADTPAITDYDDDGDVDIITFDETGDLVVYFKNLAKENKTASGLEFKRIGQCWGNFRKQFCNDFKFNVDCQATFVQAVRQNGRARVKHAGNALSVVDTDGDGRKDLLFGFVSCQNTARLRNTGPNSEYAVFASADTLFPATNPINLPIFPATYQIDTDADGQLDLLASPNIQSNDGGNATDFQSSNWLYRNTGTNRQPNYQLVQRNFLQDNMLDFGENAAPALADLDGDGDLDLLIGYKGQRDATGYRGGIYHFTNRGTPTNAAFELTTTDYLGLSKLLNATDFVPTLADVDANGSVDLAVSANGAAGNQVRLWINAAPANAAVQFNPGAARLLNLPDALFVGARPTFADIDRDGRPDVLVGDGTGSIRYYRNTGTAASPSYQLVNQEFGGLKTNLSAPNLSVTVVDFNGDRRAELLTADRNGAVKLYQMPTTPDQPLILIDLLPTLGMPGAGLIVATGDLDGDQLPDLLLGTLSGGVRYARNTSTKIVVTGLDDVEPRKQDAPWAYPNPTDGPLTVQVPHDGTLDVLNMNGQVVLPGRVVQANKPVALSLTDQPDGVYLLRLTAEGRPTATEKVVLWK